MIRIRVSRTHYQLSPSDHAVADLLMHGHQAEAIAGFLGKSVHAIKNRLSQMYARFDVPDECNGCVAMAVFLHSHRKQFGLTCLDCDARQLAS